MTLVGGSRGSWGNGASEISKELLAGGIAPSRVPQTDGRFCVKKRPLPPETESANFSSGGTCNFHTFQVTLGGHKRLG